ncbi:MAG: Gldg family protein [Gemmataceae bacterium]
MSLTQAPSGTTDVFENWAAKRRQIAYGLIGAGVALSAIPISNVALYGGQSLAFLLWGVALSLFVTSVGFVYLLMLPAPTVREEADRLRMIALLVLGGAGLLTALLGFVLPFSSTPLTVTDYHGIFAGGVSKWHERENAAALLRCGAALIGGLVVMFLGLMQARTFERTSPNLRRLLYGYNAVLSSLLLVLIMVLVNMLPYSGAWPFSYANQAIDCTRTGLHSLHDVTINVVSELRQPVKVYALGSSNDPIMKDMMELLARCRSLNPQYFSWEQLSRDRNSTNLRELEVKYNVPDSQGVLVVYGSDKKETSDFIRHNDLFKVSANPREPRFDFKGENALLNSLTFLSASKNRAVVYFTQGNGELDFKDRMGNNIDVGMGQLMEELGRVNYETRELPVTAKTETIPEDADIVVVARPGQPVPDKFVKALGDYLHGTGRKDGKKGKAILLFDVVTESGKDTMVRTGLERLAAEYGVRVNDNQLVDLDPDRDYLLIKGVPPLRSNNAIAKAFANEQRGTLSIFNFYKARSLESAKMNPPGAPAGETPDSIVLTHPHKIFLAQTDLSIKTVALMRDIQRDPRKYQDQVKLEMPLGMAVSEGKTAVPPIQGHEFMATEGQPRLVIFGDASWISNALLLRPSPNNFNLFVSCLSWLVERPDIGGRVPPTEHDIYELKAAPGSELRLLLLPGFLMVLGVLALGIGVWVVRRR